MRTTPRQRNRKPRLTGQWAAGRVRIAGGATIAAPQPQRADQRRREQEGAIAGLHQRVGVPLLLVEPVTPPLAPLEELVPLPLALPLVPGPPIELVLPEVPPLPDGLVLPAVLPDPVPLPDGLVVLEELVEPVPPAPDPAVPSRRSQALMESAAKTARVAAAH